MDNYQEKITDLEMRISFQEDTIEQLNQAIASQQNQLLIIQKQMKYLADKLKTVEPDAVVPQSQETPPPHY